MKILQINQTDGHGGAAGICLALHHDFLAAGHEAAVLVGHRTRNLSGAVQIENDEYRSAWSRCWLTVASHINRYSGRIRGAQRISERWFPWVAIPARFWARQMGHEDVYFPGTRHLIERSSFYPDLVHLHNLHGNYFDLRTLPALTRTVPTVMTMHDLWTLTGHCAHPFDCDRWRSGCGECPDLKSPPAVKKDATHFNWERKRNIYTASRLYVAAPSQWALDKMELSMLRPAAALIRLIPNGIDTSLFSPGDMGETRAQLGLPHDAKIIMFAANGIQKSPFRDFKMMRDVVRRVSILMRNEKIMFLAIGEDAPPECKGFGEIRFIPYVKDSSVLALYYRAADVYLHAALADVFPTVVLEALACGTPVVGTAVGGIPEQIVDGVTGFLVPLGDAEAMAHAVMKIIADEPLRSRMSVSAAQNATLRFGIQRMVDEYLLFYQEAAEDWKINNRELLY